MNGTTFLLLYLALLAAAFAASTIWTKAAQPEGRVLASPEPEALAWLAGGRARLTDALTARRLAAGELQLAGRGRFTTTAGEALRWADVRGGITGYADDLERWLKQQGLLTADADRATLKRWASWPFFALAALGAMRLVYGIAVDRPVGYLFMLLIITIVIAVNRRARVGRLTRGGEETLRRARDRHDRLRRAPTPAEMGLGVALFGTAVLAGSTFNDFHRFRSSPDTSGGTDSSGSWNDGNAGSGGCDGGSSGGDSGCGGGGCGGCGGGGD